VTRRGLEALAGWLAGHGVTRAGMEPAPGCRKPVFFFLERAGFGCLLYNSRAVRARPGRPEADRSDAEWLAKITGNGRVRSSFIPPEEIRVLRARVRYRRRLIQARAAQENRTGKLLEEGHVKLSPVISGLRGVTGRAIMDALAGGGTGPQVMAELARGRLRGKITEIAEAPGCSFFTPALARLPGLMRALTGQLTARTGETDAVTAGLRAPSGDQIARLEEVPGIARRSAGDVIAGTGTDMTAFPDARRLVSRAELCPRVRESAGRRKGRSGTGDGNVYLSAAISEAVTGALRTGSFPAARHKRLIRRMPEKKALAASGSTLLTIIWHLLPGPGAACTDPGAGYCQRQDPERQKPSHVRNLERPGFHVALSAAGPATGELTAA
jgi:transposase